MEKSKVYFSDLRTHDLSTLDKLKRLMKEAGFEQIDFKGNVPCPPAIVTTANLFALIASIPFSS